MIARLLFRGFLPVFFLFGPVFLVNPQNSASRGGLFIQGGGQYYLFPGKPFADALPGLRLGGGWEFPVGRSSFSLGMEVGFTYSGVAASEKALIQADSFFLVPISLSVQYAFHLVGGFSLNPGVLAGGMVITTGQNTSLDFFFGPRLYGEGRVGSGTDGLSWSLYAGGGSDFIIKQEGLIIMPVMEIGVRFRPMSNSRKRKAPAEPEAPPPARKPAETPPDEPADMKSPLALVYFEQDSAEPLEGYTGAFALAGLYLLQNPAARLIIRGYANPAEPEGIAQYRAQQCADILVKQYGVAENRLSVVAFGSQKLPFRAEAEYPATRCAVEFFSVLP